MGGVIAPSSKVSATPPPHFLSVTPQKPFSLAERAANAVKNGTMATPITSRDNPESAIELAFKVKRANANAESHDLRTVTNSVLINPSNGIQNAEYIGLPEIRKTPAQARLLFRTTSACYIFSSFGPNEMAEVVSCMVNKHVAKNYDLIKQGEDGADYYVIFEGRFAVVVGEKVVATLHPGTGFGELALLYNSPRQATVRALSDAMVFCLTRTQYKAIARHSALRRRDEIRMALKRVPLFSSMNEKTLDEMSQVLEIFPFNANDIIVKRGMPGSTFYIIKEGTVAVTDLDPQFNGHTLMAGDYFGEQSLLKNEPREGTFIATTTVKVMALDKAAFERFIVPLRAELDRHVNLRILASVKLFETLTLQERKKLSKSFRLESYSQGRIIIQQGDTGSEFFIVKDGVARVEVMQSVVARLKAGSYFGEMALLTNDLRMASVVAETDCQCFVLHRDEFRKISGALSHISRESETRKGELNHIVKLKSADPAATAASAAKAASIANAANAAAVAAAAAANSPKIEGKKQNDNVITMVSNTDDDDFVSPVR